jgi:hypothetical protein
VSSQAEGSIVISVEQVVDVVGGFDDSGGASLGLVAWDLCVEEQNAARAWEQAQRDELLKPAGRDPELDEQLWKLTPRGWAEQREAKKHSSAA